MFGFDRVRMVRKAAPWVSQDSSWFVWFVPVRHLGRWGRSRWSGSQGCSSGCALAVAGFVLFVWFVLVRPGGRWVRSGYSSSSLAVAGFFRVHFGGPLGSIEFVGLV